MPTRHRWHRAPRVPETHPAADDLLQAHAVDLDTGAVVGVTVQDADTGDAETSQATPSAPMFRRGPLTFADDGQSGAVNDEVQAGARAGAPKREGEMLTAARERGVIGCREIDAQHPEDRCQEAVGGELLLSPQSVEIIKFGDPGSGR